MRSVAINYDIPDRLNRMKIVQDEVTVAE